jgi:hypothetical protein
MFARVITCLSDYIIAAVLFFEYMCLDQPVVSSPEGETKKLPWKYKI